MASASKWGEMSDGVVRIECDLEAIGVKDSGRLSKTGGANERRAAALPNKV